MRKKIKGQQSGQSTWFVEGHREDVWDPLVHLLWLSAIHAISHTVII